MIDDDTLNNIEKLHKLKADGIITQEDFDKAKADLLSGRGRTRSKPAATSPATPAEPKELPADDDHLGWMTLPLKRYADFTGRSTRKEFWMFLLLTNLVGGALAILALADTNSYGATGEIGSLMFGLIGILMLGVFVPILAAQVRRLHDQGPAGWRVAHQRHLAACAEPRVSPAARIYLPTWPTWLGNTRRHGCAADNGVCRQAARLVTRFWPGHSHDECSGSESQCCTKRRDGSTRGDDRFRAGGGRGWQFWSHPTVRETTRVTTGISNGMGASAFSTAALVTCPDAAERPECWEGERDFSFARVI